MYDTISVYMQSGQCRPFCKNICDMELKGNFIFVDKEELKKVLNEILDERDRRKAANEKDEKYLSVAEIKERYGISRSTLKNWEKDGYLRPCKLGRRVLYPKSIIDRKLKGEEDGTNRCN